MTKQDKTRLDTTKQDQTRLVERRQDTRRQPYTRQDKTGEGKTGQDKTCTASKRPTTNTYIFCSICHKNMVALDQNHTFLPVFVKYDHYVPYATNMDV
jgi:hypothetical protein